MPLTTCKRTAVSSSGWTCKGGANAAASKLTSSTRTWWMLKKKRRKSSRLTRSSRNCAHLKASYAKRWTTSSGEVLTIATASTRSRPRITSNAAREVPTSGAASSQESPSCRCKKLNQYRCKRSTIRSQKSSDRTLATLRTTFSLLIKVVNVFKTKVSDKF